MITDDAVSEPDGGEPLGPLTGWCLTSGSTGHEVQCLGVLEALGIEPVIKRVAPGGLHALLAPWGPAAPDAGVVPPWPDVLVVSGRQSIPYGRAVRRRSGRRSFVLAMQSPGVPASWFDLVWVPQHDRLRGANVITTLTSPHRLTPERLTEAASKALPAVAHLPRPLVTVLVGGPSGAYQFGRAEAEKLAGDLAAFADRHGCGLLVTPSRRTGVENVAVLREHLAQAPAAVWDLSGDNPYFGYVGLADAFIATCDSVNMLGEAAFTGRPVYAYKLPGGSDKFQRFHDALLRHGAMRWFDGDLDGWTYPTLDATSEIAAVVRDRLSAHLRRRPEQD